MATVRHIDSSADRWIWIESLPDALVVLSLVSRTVVAINGAARVLLGVSRPDLVGRSTTHVVPEYLLPNQEVVSQWIDQAAAGQTPGFSIDLLTETPGSDAIRLSAHFSPADGSGQFILLRLGPTSGESAAPAVGTDDVLRGLMSDIGRIVSSSLNLGTVCQQFAVSLMQVVPADRVAILLTSGESDSLSIAFSSEQESESGPLNTLQLSPVPRGPIARAIKTHTSVLLDAQEVGDIAFLRIGAQHSSGGTVLSACSIPLIAGGNCIGVVLLGSSQPEAYSPDDMLLLEQASSQVAGAISNVMLHEALSRSAGEREVLANIGRLASAVIDFARAMPGIAAEVRRIMPISELCIYELDDREGGLKRSYVWAESGIEIKYGAESISGAAEARESCIAGGRPVVSTMWRSDQDQPVAMVTVALRSGGQAIGSLTAISTGAAEYTSLESSFAALVANQIAGTVQTARIYRRQQREANLRRTLAEISVAASRDLAPDRVFERIANEVAELIEYDLFAIASHTPDRSGLGVRFKVGHDGPLNVYEDQQPEGSGDLYEWRAQLVRPVFGSSQFSSLADQGINSLIEVSLGAEETGATGYILVGSSSELSFGSRELRMLVQVASQVSPAIQNATAHEQAVALAEARTSEAKAEARSLELERISDAKSRFLSIVSHELRTPLTSIIAYAELLERNTGDRMGAKQIKQASVINKSAAHLKFLISDLLDVSRIESGNLSLEMSTFNIADAVQDVVDQFEPVLTDKSQEFEVHIAHENIEIYADRSRIVQVVSNLVENASKYSPPETLITVDVHRRGLEIVITVSDQGIGISSEDQRQLFVPFFRANSELTRTEPGTGLGLALVKSIADLHGGSVSVHSEPGGGSTFSVALRAAAGTRAA